MKTEIITTQIDTAADIIRAGGLVAVPTETVYGLAGNGLDAAAVERIYEVKGRPAIKPLALMVPGADAMERYCEDVPAQAKTLANKYWPGPLTIIMKSKDIVPDIVRAGGDTVGLRCPDHALTLKALKAAGVPFAAPSANPSGEPSPKNAGKVIEYFDGKIDAIIDGGECGIGTESTIIDMSRTPYRILRLGALNEDEVFDTLVSGMTVVGITGGTGCGKTTALSVLRDMGARIIDCDAVYHELLSTDSAMLDEIEEHFPGTLTDGRLDRKALGRIVFNNDDRLAVLSRITHRYVGREVRRILREHAINGAALAAIDAIALIESGLADMCDITFAVTADREDRIRRIMARDGIDRAYAEMRINAQKPDAFFAQSCTHLLQNDTTEREFADKCRKIFTEVL